GMLGLSTAKEGVTLERTMTVNRPPREVYDFWHNIENLPRFMKHLESVRATDGGRSHWVAKGPGGITVEWDAETTEDRPAECISWRSTEEADISNAGTVEFHEAPGGRGTELKVKITYLPPLGAAGRVAGEIGNYFSAQQIEEDLKRFKQVMESGEITTAARTIQ
ncbi:MAG TPA: SRPBCC family protein, partial [Verrucomicrobiae bacterium]|nr:SRPBCC family protein [Verrucomicrobiae bacterium]